MVDECGDEVKVETFNVGNDLDEDYMELWKDRKIEKARESYPEAQRFYFERPYSDMSYGELLACMDNQKVRLSYMNKEKALAKLREAKQEALVNSTAIKVGRIELNEAMKALRTVIALQNVLKDE